MVSLTPQQIMERHDEESACRVWYKNHKQHVAYGCLSHVNWPRVAKITVLFPEPKYFRINGDACKRDGVAYLVKGN